MNEATLATTTAAGEGAAGSPCAPGMARARRAELDAALAQPVRCSLDADLGVIAVRGADAVSFLQGQLTNDSAGLDSVQVQPTGFCTAKGRLLATFEQWRTAEPEGEVLLQLPGDLLPGLLKRLSMFVLRAKARLGDASQAWHTEALFGPGSAALVARAFGTVPAVGATATSGALRVSRMRAGTRCAERFVLRAPREVAVPASLAEARAVASDVWWWSQIDAAMPVVVAATQEAFVPQMINFEVLGGVNFKKGCYPGQEVVARSQYLGKLRRRMSLAHAAAEPALGAGSDLLLDGLAEPAGKVVATALAPGGGLDVLFECPVDRLDAGVLRLADGSALALRPLPYPLVDVTA